MIHQRSPDCYSWTAVVLPFEFGDSTQLASTHAQHAGNAELRSRYTAPWLAEPHVAWM